MSDIDYNRLVALKPLSTYPNEVLKNVKLVTVRDSDHPILFGSYIYRAQKYPSDVDVIEEYDDISVNNLVISFKQRIQQMVGNIIQLRDHYITEFKAGIDERFHLNFGMLKEGIFTMNKSFPMMFDKIKDLLTDDEYHKIEMIIRNKNRTVLQYEILNEILYDLYTIRWNKEEVLQGFKTLRGDLIYYLEEGIISGSKVKIDMIALINGKYTEVTNFFALVIKTKVGLKYPINTDYLPGTQEFRESQLGSLKEQIEVLLFSELEYSPFKAAKRMWAFARSTNDKEMIFKLTKFVTGNVSQLYQVRSGIGDIITLLTKTSADPQTSISYEIQNFKISLSTIIEIPSSDIEIINNMINNIDTVPRHQKILILKQVSDYLKKIINIFTEQFYNEADLRVPPLDYLPNPLRYISKSEYKSLL